ncbi:MAG: uroporphyrinogen-III C-methyltransferase [Phycisphaerae bacterium]|nr:uroporphyrinogen-III C-methyltransferase [Phycisphaerae bacterium]
MAEKSKVYIIGAGPGSSGLISVRGLQILQRADCVLYDRLIGRELLDIAPKRAELIYVGKEHTRRPPKQADINHLIIKNAHKYKTIIRLKGGDALIFGRATEELKCLADNKIDFEIIPGITAASAAAACAGIVLTDRNTASSVTYVTGQTVEGKPVNIDFKSLVKLSGTIVFYMAVGNMKQICQRLIKSGLAANTNAVVVANASLANQKIVKSTVADIAKKCERENIESPAVMIIGKKCFSWLQSQPLFGKRILMTRDSPGNAELACKLAARGACAISYPTFKLLNLTGTKKFKRIIGKIKNFDWVFFTSPTGVRLFFKAAEKLNKDARIFAGAKIACIGSETANALEDFGIKADFVPKVFTSDQLAKSFIKKYKPAGRKILLLRSALADSALAEKLKSAKAKIKQVSIYTAKKIENNPKEITENDIDWIVFASSFAVDCFFKDFKPKDISKKVKIASIGPAATDTIKKFGIKPTVESKEHTFDGLIEAMEKVINKKIKFS